MFQRHNFSRSHSDIGDGKKLAVILAVVAVLAAAGLWMWGHYVTNPIKRDTYQLVSLETGEVYFGKLQSLSGEYVTLKRVYTQAPEENRVQDGAAAGQNGVVLNRLSVSVAKPEDTMYIARDKIVHWENLQRDSKIVQAIENDNK